MGSKPKSKLASMLSFDHVGQAERCLEEGDLARAAKLFERAKDFRRATRYYAEAGNQKKAIETAIKAVLGPKAKAEPEADLKYAAGLLVSVGGRKEAVPLFELAGEYEEAARSAAKSGQRLRAAQLFDRAKSWPKAAAYYERAGKLREAIRSLDHEMRRLQGRQAHDHATLRELARVQRQRGALVARLGDPVAATQIGGSAPAGGLLLERAGQFRKAMEAYLDSRDFDQALRLVREQPSLEDRLQGDILKRAGEPKKAAQVYGALGFAQQAAAAWAEAGEWRKAARQWKKCRQPSQAAEAYLKAQLPLLAAKCFEQADLPEKALEIYRRSGDVAKLAECQLRLGRTVEAAASYLQARKYMAAAELLLAAGKKAEAVDVLQQVPATDANFGRATLLATEALFEAGKLKEALHRVLLLTADVESAGEIGLDRVYWEGRIREAMDREIEALTCYEKLVGLAPKHRDTEHRLADLRRRMTTTHGVTAATAPPAAGPQAAIGMATGEPTMPALAISQATPEAASQIAQGSVLAERYELLEEVGSGGMGRVYKAFDRVLEEPVAIKTLLQEKGLHGGEEARLLREVQICRKLTHPNIVRVHDIRRFERGVFIIMELLEGKSLDQLLTRHKPLKLAQTRNIVSQVAAGLGEAHAVGVVHRDLKPGNLLLAGKRIKILDFGIARMPDARTQLTQTGHILGSPHYMSPEQMQGQPLDGRSDIYSLGILTFRLLTGNEPFMGEAVTEILLAHLQEDPPDLRKLRPGLPEVWASFVAKMLAKDPSERFQSTAELQAMLATLPLEAPPA